MPRRLFAAVTVVLVVAGTLASCAETEPRDASADIGSGFVVGALLDLTGDWATLGETSQAALAIAAESVNADGEALGVRVVVEDTAGDPDEALNKLQALAEQGITFVVGPQSSAEVRAVKDFADSNDIVIVSQGSTASDLAIADDNVLRFIPGGRQESEALAALLVADGIESVVPIWRDDLGNSDLVATLRKATEAEGIFMTDGVGYSTENPDFTASLDEIKVQIAATTGRIGIYLAGFSEVAELFEVASADADLVGFAWYGSDGVVLNRELVANAAAAEFAAAIGFPSPIFGLDPAYEDEWGPVVDEIEAETGLAAEAYTIAAHDALAVGWEAQLRSVGSEDFRMVYESVAAESTGLNGSTALDSNGDRDSGAFTFYAICPSGDGWEWQIVGSFVPADSAQLASTGCS